MAGKTKDDKLNDLEKAQARAVELVVAQGEQLNQLQRKVDALIAQLGGAVGLKYEEPA